MNYTDYYRDMLQGYTGDKARILGAAEMLHSGGNPASPPTLQDLEQVAADLDARGPSEFTKGLKGGFHSTIGMLGAGAGMMGDAVGADSVRDWGYGVYKGRMEDASAYAPKVQDIRDVDSWSDAANWFMSTLGQLTPTMAEIALTAVAGGGIAGIAGRKLAKDRIEATVKGKIKQKVSQGIAEDEAKGLAEREAKQEILGQITKRGRQTGTVVGSGALEGGGMYGDAADSVGIEDANPYVALGLGTVSGLTELGTPFGRVITKGLPPGSGRLRNRLLRKTTGGMGQEGFQEGVQHGISETSAKIHDPSHTIEPGSFLNPIAAGAIVGAPFGALEAIPGERKPGEIEAEDTDIDPEQVLDDREQGLKVKPGEPVDLMKGQEGVDPLTNYPPPESTWNPETDTYPGEEESSDEWAGYSARPPIPTMSASHWSDYELMTDGERDEYMLLRSYGMDHDAAVDVAVTEMATQEAQAQAAQVPEEYQESDPWAQEQAQWEASQAEARPSEEDRNVMQSSEGRRILRERLAREQIDANTVPWQDQGLSTGLHSPASRSAAAIEAEMIDREQRAQTGAVSTPMPSQQFTPGFHTPASRAMATFQAIEADRNQRGEPRTSKEAEAILRQSPQGSDLLRQQLMREQNDANSTPMPEQGFNPGYFTPASRSAATFEGEAIAREERAAQQKAQEVRGRQRDASPIGREGLRRKLKQEEAVSGTPLIPPGSLMIGGKEVEIPEGVEVATSGRPYSKRGAEAKVRKLAKAGKSAEAVKLGKNAYGVKETETPGKSEGGPTAPPPGEQAGGDSSRTDFREQERQRILKKYADILNLPEVTKDDPLYNTIDDRSITPEELRAHLEKSEAGEVDRVKSLIADHMGDLIETYLYEGFADGQAIEKYIDSLLETTRELPATRVPDQDTGAGPDQEKGPVPDDSGITPPKAAPTLTHDPNNDGRYYGTEVLINEKRNSRGDITQKEKPGVIDQTRINQDGETLVEVKPDGMDSSFRLPLSAVTITKLVDNGTVERKPQAPVKPKEPEQPFPKRKTVIEIADEIAAEGVDPQASYGRYVKEMDLKPEIDAAEWLVIYKQALELAKTTAKPTLEAESPKGEGTGQSSGQRRAKAGGEYGENGEWYEGGKFIATTDHPKGQPDNYKPTGKKQVEPGEWVNPPDTQPKRYLSALFGQLSGVEVRKPDGSFELNPDLKGETYGSREEREARIAKWNAGFRWQQRNSETKKPTGLYLDKEGQNGEMESPRKGEKFALPTKEPEDVFPKPEKKVIAEKVARENGEVLTAKEGEARIAEWKAHAKRIGKEEDHSNEIIISLFDRTGAWSQPYRDAGYTVLQYDIANGDDLMEFSPSSDIIDARETGGEVVGVLSAPPCTSLSVSGAQHWPKHDAKDIKKLEATYGWQASRYHDSATDYAKTLLMIVGAIVELANPSRFHVLENPVGRIQVVGGFPDPLMTFQPHNYGDPYTKKTQLWGDFSPDLPQANVEPTEGSKMWKMPPSKERAALRSATPEGFAYSFFMANNTSKLKFEQAPGKISPKDSKTKTPENTGAETSQGKNLPETLDPIVTGTTKGANVSVPMTKAEENALTPKEQKSFLMEEIDAAIEAAPVWTPPPKKRFTKEQKKEQAAHEKEQQEKVAALGTVTIEVPGDGVFSIFNSKHHLKAFKKRAAKFPTVAQVHKKEPVPSGKGRLKDFAGSYYNPFKPRNRGVVLPTKQRGIMNIEGDLYSDGNYLVRFKKKPAIPSGMKEAKLPDGAARVLEHTPESWQEATIKGETYRDLENDPRNPKKVIAHVETSDERHYLYDARYVDSVLTVWPKAKTYVSNGVLYFSDGKQVVGMVMPLHEGGGKGGLAKTDLPGHIQAGIWGLAHPMPEPGKKSRREIERESLGQGQIDGDENARLLRNQGPEEKHLSAAYFHMMKSQVTPEESKTIRAFYAGEEGLRKLRAMRTDRSLFNIARAIKEKALGQEKAEPVPETAAAPAPPKAPKKAPAKKTTRKSRKAGDSKTIEDFGEKLGGARKDYASSIREAKGVDPASVPLSQAFPQPNYQNLIDRGVDPTVVALVRAIREEIPPKPKRQYKLNEYTKTVEAFRDISVKLLDGTMPPKAFTDKFATTGGIVGRAELYERVGHAKSLKNYRFGKREWSLYKGEKNVVLWQVDRPSSNKSFFGRMNEVLAEGKTKEEVLADFAKIHTGLGAKAKSERRTKFDYYHKGGDRKTVWVGKKVGREYIDLKSFPSLEEARKYEEGHYDELQAELERAKYVPHVRREKNEARIGEDHRNGKDVTTKMFEDAFLFRGVEFGNWVGKKKERQGNLNDAYDALHDLALLIGVPTQALSLNGKLGLGFGSRGVGGKRAAAAHYEPAKVVINLTRKAGAGSLAHEWWHAVDNYFSRERGKISDYMSEKPYKAAIADETRPEVLAAFKDIMAAANQTGLPTRSKALDKPRSKKYWSTGREIAARIFENYIIDKLKSKGATSDYLANIGSEATFEDEMSKKGRMEGTYPYLRKDEIKPVSEAFDTLFKTLKTEKTDKGYKLYSLGDLGFFSTVAKAIGAMDFKAMPPQDLLSRLRKTPGVKLEELEDLGLEPWLADQKGKVTKEAVLGFVKDGGPQLIESVQASEVEFYFSDTMGDARVFLNKEEAQAAFDAEVEWIENEAAYVNVADDKQTVSVTNHNFDELFYAEYVDNNDIEDTEGVWDEDQSGWQYRYAWGAFTFDPDLDLGDVVEMANDTAEEQRDSYREQMTEIEEEDSDESGVEYGEWQTLGGENYREVLLKTVVETEYEKALRAFVARVHARLGKNHFDYNDLTPKENDELREIEGAPHRVTAYKSPHWNHDTNVLAHYRLKDHYVDGQKVLLVEELQSDWHQEGRREGYANPRIGPPEGHRVVQPEPDTDRYSQKGVPNAPFKKSWPMVAFKRILRLATEQGYSAVAWTGGEVQANRYNLSTAVSKIFYSPPTEKDGVYVTGIEDLDGKMITGLRHPTDGTLKTLEPLFGKDITKRMANREGTFRDGVYELSGDKLEIGGAGMKAFYDQIMVKEVGKYIKKLDGSVKVEPGSLDNVKIGGVWTFPLTYKMKDAISAGQALYSKDKGASGSISKAEIESLPMVQRVTGRNGRYRLHFKNGISVPLSSVKLKGENAFVVTPQGEKLVKRGWYSPDGITITQYGDKHTVSHEAFHFMEDIGVITRRDRALLNKEVGKGLKAGELAEARARFVEKAMRDREKYRGTAIGAILQKIRDFIDSMLNVFTRTTRGVVRDFEMGAAASKTTAGSVPTSPKGRREEIGDTGGPLSTQKVTETAAFKKWSGGAEVVTDPENHTFKTGEPVVVTAYHGTRGDHEYLRPSDWMRSGFLGRGVHFTTDRAEAERYSSNDVSVNHDFGPKAEVLAREGDMPYALAKKIMSQGEPVVYEAYVRLSKPLVLGEAPIKVRQSVFRLAAAEADISQEEADLLWKKFHTYTTAKEQFERVLRVGKGAKFFRQVASLQNMDGVVLTNGLAPKAKGAVHLLAFEPEQIKSTTNRGTFDPIDPRMQYSLGGMDEVKADLKDTFNEAREGTAKFAKKAFTTKYWKELKEDLSSPSVSGDVSGWSRAFSLISSYSRKNPALQREYEAAEAKPSHRFEIEEDLTHLDETNMLKAIIDFGKNFPRAYKKISRYLNKRDVWQQGYSVKQEAKEDGMYILYNLQGKPTKVRSKDREAVWEIARQWEQADYYERTGSREAAQALYYTRKLMDAEFVEKYKPLEEYIAQLEANKEPTVVAYQTPEGPVMVDLKLALKKMGERRGYYMPRIWKPGNFNVFAKKEGDEFNIVEKFDKEFDAKRRVRELKEAGYEAHHKASEKPAEELYNTLASTSAQESMTNMVLSRVGPSNRVMKIEDIGLHGRWDGTTYVVEGQMEVEYAKAFEKLGGTKKERTFHNGRHGYWIEWTFPDKIEKGLPKELKQKARTAFEDQFRAVVFEIKGTDANTPLAMVQEFIHEYAKTLKARGARQSLIERSNAVGFDVYTGYEEDLTSRLSQSIHRFASGKAKQEMALNMILAINGRDVSWDEFKAIKKFKGNFEAWEKTGSNVDRATFEEVRSHWVKEPHFPDYQEFVQGRMIDPSKHKTAYTDAMDLFKHMLRNEESMDRAVGFLKGLAVLKYLGFRPSAAVINMTNMVAAVPAVITAETGASFRTTFKHIKSGMTRFTRYRAGKDKLTDNAKEDAEARKVFDYIHHKGWDQGTFNSEALGAIQTRTNRYMSAIIDTSMKMFGWTESLNRAATIYAAYKAQTTGTFKERMDKAHSISNDSHGVYSKANKPAVMRGGGIGANALQMAYVFKTFSHNYLTTMFRLGFKQHEAKAALYMAMAPAIFGASSAFGVKALIQGVGMALGAEDPEEDFYRVIGDNFGATPERLVRFGLPGALGMDLTGSMRIGIADLPTDMKGLIGAPGDVLLSLYHGAKEMGRGNVRKGFERVMPNAVGNVSKAFREYGEGVTTKSNAPVFYRDEPLKANEIDFMLRLFSFNPAHISQARSELWTQKKKTYRLRDERSEIYDRIRKFMMSKRRSKSDWRHIVVLTERFNDKAPEGTKPIDLEKQADRIAKQIQQRR